MQPDAVAKFVAAFSREVNRQRNSENAKRAKAEKDRAALAKKLDGPYDAVANGLRTAGLLERLEKMESELRERDEAFVTPELPSVRLHPNLAEQYRNRVNDLTQTLKNPGLRTTVLEIIRSLIQQVTVTVDQNGDVLLELFGAFTVMIDVDQPCGVTDADHGSVKLVAGGSVGQARTNKEIAVPV